eukprot:16713_1
MEQLEAMSTQYQYWSIGRNKYGDQCNGTTLPVTKLELIKSISNNPNIQFNIQDIIIGNESSVYLVCNDQTRIIVCGNNSRGELGTIYYIINRIIYSYCPNISVPNDVIMLIDLFIDTHCELFKRLKCQTRPFIIDDYKIKHISSGIASNHRFILTKQNTLYAIGSNYALTLNKITNKDNVYNFTEIKYFKDNKIILKEIACSWTHSLFLSENGKVYSCGQSNTGVLGLGDNINKSNGIQLMNINKIIITHIACGSNHNLVITAQKELYGWGNNMYGQLLNTKFTLHKPELITYFADSELTIEKISCGCFHSMVLDVDGRVYCFGQNDLSQCILVNDGTPIIIPISFNKMIVDIKCGAYHNVICTKTGEYYLWGYNKYNQCLVYNGSDVVTTPTKYYCQQDFDGIQYRIDNIYPGYFDTKIITTCNAHVC